MYKQESNKIQKAFISHTYLDNQSMQYPLPTTTVIEGQITSQTNRMFGIDYYTKWITPWSRYKNENEEFRILSIEKKTHDEDNLYQILYSQAMQTGWVSKIVWPVNLAPSGCVDLGRLRLRQLLHRLRIAGAHNVADRIKYLTSEENAEDGGDIPRTASINSFVNFYLDNSDLGAPHLGATPNGELQAVWELSERRRLVAEYLDDNIVKYVYRRAGKTDSSNLFVLGQQPRHKIREILDNVSI